MDTAAHEWPHKGILGVVESSERQLLLPEIQAAAAAAERRSVMRGPQKEHAINCPRCDSTNTKFCYYNNYSLSQPRYFCKTCRRYWTAGGTLRNVPVGGGSRKNKKSSSSSSSAANPRPSQHPIHLASYKLYHGAAAHDLSPTLAGPAQFVNPEPLSSPEPAGSLFGAAGFGFRELIMGPAAASSMKMHPLSGGLLFPFEDLKHVSMMNESDKAAVVLQGSDPTFFWNGGAGGNGGGSW